MSTATYQPKQVAIAALVGLVAQAVLLAFSLHVGLIFSDLAGSNLGLYWALNGVYMVVAIAAALAFIPWHRPAVRYPVAAALLIAFGTLGYLSAP